MLEQYVHLLEQIATAPEKSINEYSLVTASASPTTARSDDPD